MANPGDEAAAAGTADETSLATAEPSAAEPMEVKNPLPPASETGNGEGGSEADISQIEPTPMDVDGGSTTQTTGCSATNSSSTPSATVSYTHACFLCCRKFTSLEQLLKHQAKSKLHKTNLEREKALKKEKEEAEGREKSDGSDRDDEDDGSDDDSDSVAGDRSTKRKHRSSSSSSLKRPSIPRRLRSRMEGPVQVWRCSSCNNAYFDTYEEAFEHEARCGRQASGINSSSDSDRGDVELLGNDLTKGNAAAKAEAKEKTSLERKIWKEEDKQLKAKGIELGGKGVSFNLTAEDKKVLSDYNAFLLENVEMFVVEREYNDQLAAIPNRNTGSMKHRAEGTVGLRCVHCKYRPCGERAASSCVFPGSLSMFSTRIHRVVRVHWPNCLSLPDNFTEQVKADKDNGLIGLNTFMKKHGGDRFHLEESAENDVLQFAGTELYDSNKETAPHNSERPKKTRGRPRLSDKEKQHMQMENTERQIERKREKRKKRKKKKRENALLESITQDQVPFGLSKSDPKDAFSPLHKLLREATEVFVIRTRNDAIDLTPFGDPLLRVGSCGLRCKFCQDHCVFPAHVEDIYNKVRRGIQDHISSGECDAMPASLKRRYFAVENEARSLNIGTLYRTRAKEVGLYDVGERQGLGLRGVSTALVNANIEGSSSSSSSNSDSDSDGDAMSVSSSSSSAADERDDESDKDEDSNDRTKSPIAARNATALCNHPGCSKHKQYRCEGFCIRHYRESLALFDSDQSSAGKGPLRSVSGFSKTKLKKNKQDISPTGITKAASKESRVCSVPGCTKQSQYKCNGMCMRHDSESKLQDGESDNDSGDAQSSSSESDTEQPLVSDLLLSEERASISPFRLKLLSSLQLCYLSPKDAAKNYKRRKFPLGLPGVRCKYCHKLKVFAIADTLWLSKGKQKNHLDECSGIHYKQKLHLDRLEREEEEADRSLFTVGVPKKIRANIYKRMVERAESEKYLSKKAGKKLLKTAKERSANRKKEEKEK